MKPSAGLIGCGHIGSVHAQAVSDAIRRGLVDAVYTGVCDRDSARAEAFVAAAGLPLCTADPQRLIDGPRVNTVYICTHTSEHRDLVLAAARRPGACWCSVMLQSPAVAGAIVRKSRWASTPERSRSQAV